MRRAPVVGRLLALSVGLLLSADLSHANPPVAADAGSPVSIAAPRAAARVAESLQFDPSAERIINTNDSLAFSPELVPPPGRGAMDQGAGFVRAILETQFGQTAWAAVLFDRRAILYVLLAAGACCLEWLYRRGACAAIELPLPALGMGGGRTLPVVGDEHPVGRLSVRFSQRAAGFAILLHLMLLGTWLEPPPRIQDPREIPQGGGLRIAGFKTGLPEAVQDWLAPDETIAPIEDMGSLYKDGTGSGDDVWPAPEVGERIPLPRENGLVSGPVPFDPGAVPVLVHMPTPTYPEIARTAEVQGIVVLQILVGVDGRVADVRVLRGHPMLNEAALRAARGARFQPATQQRRPVAVWVEFPVRFTLY